MAGSAIREIRITEVERPLRTTFATALGSKDRLRSVLVEVSLGSGEKGVGEVPTSAAFPGETVPAIRAVLGEARARLRGADIESWAEHARAFRGAFPQARMTVSGLEVALFRASLAGSGITEHAWFGGRAGRVETDITLPFLADKAALASWIGYALKKGFTAFKVKVSGRPDADREVVSFIHRSLASMAGSFRLRLDGNQGYTARTFLQFVDSLAASGWPIELFEQPLPKGDLAGLAYIRARSPVPIILDETVVTVEDAKRAMEHGACDGINIKLAKSGITESMALLELGAACGMRLMIGCMVETMVGLSAAVFLAAGSAAFDFIDLDSVHFLYGANRWPGIGREGPTFMSGHQPGR